MKLREFEKCASCGRGMAAAGIHFYRVEVEQLVLDQPAIQRQHGLEMMLGDAALASALGPDEDLAVSVGKGQGLLCAECGLRMPAAVMLEAATSCDGEPGDG